MNIRPTFLYSVIVSVFAMGLFACKKSDSGGGTTNPPTATYPKQVTIEYRVTGTGVGSGSGAYTNESGGNSSYSFTSLPYSKIFTRTVKQYDNATILVNAVGTGNIKVDILVNSTVVKTQSYSGTSVFGGTLVYLFE